MMLPLQVAGTDSVVVFMLLASRAAPLVKLGQNVVCGCWGNKAARVIAKTVTSACVLLPAPRCSYTGRRMERTSAAADTDRVLAGSQLLAIAFISCGEQLGRVFQDS